MITKYGMSDRLGPITYGSSHDEVFLGKDYTTMRNYSEKIAAEIDDEIQSYINDAYHKCEEILNNNLESLHAVAGYLLKHESMDGEVFNRIMAGDDIAAIEADEEEKARLHAEEEAKRRAEDERRRAEEEARRRAERERNDANRAAPPPPWMPPLEHDVDEKK